MADIKKGSDLITTMGATEARLKKVERQLAVPRRGDASVSTELVTVTGSGISLSDPVTIVLTAKCLIHIWAVWFMKVTDANAQIDFGVEIQGSDPSDYAARSLVRYATSSGFAPTTYQQYGTTAKEQKLTATQHQGENLHAISLPNQRNPAGLGATMAQGKATVTLNVTVGSAATLSIKERRLFAWVQPF